MNREERTHEYYERALLHTDCKTAKGKPIKPIEYFDKVDAIVIPEGATNGDMVKVVFPNFEENVTIVCDTILLERYMPYCKMQFHRDWWDSPYERR